MAYGAAARKPELDPRIEPEMEPRAPAPPRSTRMLRRSVSSWAQLCSPSVQLGIAVVTVSALFILMGVMPRFARPLGALLVVLHVGAALVGWLMSGAALEREARWARSLPFDFEGYLDRLGQPVASKSLELHLSFAGAGPELARAADLGRRVSKQLAVSALGSGIRIVDNSCDGDDNALVMDRCHGLVEQLLLPLHTTHPIARVRVMVGPALDR
jgi:hypothetical protein